MTLETRSGIDIGADISYYRYRAPSDGATISGPHYGAELTGAINLGQGIFASLDGDYAIGWMNYTGSGSADNRRNTTWDGRALIGKDFVFEDFSISPFTGFAYRERNDGNATSDTGVPLLLRENQTFYAPVGIRPRFRMDDDARISTTLEYDFVASAMQTTHLSGTDPTVHSPETGYGFHIDMMYETPWWSVGPYGSYWLLNTSEASVYHSPGSTCGSTTCSFTEPSNHTIEGGVQFKLHLF